MNAAGATLESTVQTSEESKQLYKAPSDNLGGFMTVISVLGKPRQEDHCGSEATLNYTERPCLKKRAFNKDYRNLKRLDL